MRKTLLVTSILSSWGVAMIYYQINRITGMEPKTLLYIAIAVMVFGLYAGLYTNDKVDTREES